MVNLTISLPEDTVRRLRKAVKERYGGKKGAISGVVREALEEHIGSLERTPSPTVYKAFEGETLVAEADDLEGLSQKLRAQEIDPRVVRVLCSRPVSHVTRMGLPAKRV